MFKRSPLLLLTAALLALYGCDSGSSGLSGQITAGTEEGINAPDRIRESFVVDFAQVTGTLTINGQTFQMSRLANDQFQVQIPNIAVNSVVTVEVEYRETLPDGSDLLLGRSFPIEQSVGNSNLTINIPNSGFDYSFDDDQDGISNIIEREQGSDPFTPENSLNRSFLIQFNIPQRINEPAITRPIVLLNDMTRITSPPDGDFLIISTGVVPSSFDVDIDIRLTQLFEGSEVLVAQAVNQQSAGEEDLFVVLTDEDFNFSLDNDLDGIFNIDELENGTDPFTAN